MATTNISSVDEENYLRMNLLLTGVASRAVRVLFDYEFAPEVLEKTLKIEQRKLLKLKNKRVINANQWKLLFPYSGNPDSKTFDVTLMVVLLNNLTDDYARCDGKPCYSSTKPIHDLARIVYYRNQLAHRKDAKIESKYFENDWEDICGAVGRLGRLGRLEGQNLERECKELTTKCLDQLTVPWDKRKEIGETLFEWRKTDTIYFKTSAAQKVLEYVKENSCVTVTASFGVGKTAMLQHIALKMADEGYDVLPVTNPHDIVKFHNPYKKTLFVIDDFCGKYSINQFDLERWKTFKWKVEELIENKNTKIIVSCRLQIFKDEKFETLSIFRNNVCNLISKKFCISQKEKMSIAENCLETEVFNSDIIKYCGLFDCFPLLCTFYHDHPTLSINNFFQNPFEVYEAEFEKLKQNDFFSKYCALALCVMFNNTLVEDMLTDTIIKNICDACSSEEIPKLTLLDELNSLEHTFIQKDEGLYTILNDKLFGFLSYYFGKNIIQCLIKNAHHQLIGERFVLEIEKDMDQFITLIPFDYHQMYIQRMVDDWYSGEVVTVFNNKNMKHNTFRQRYLSYLKTLDLTDQKILANKVDKVHNDTVLIQCCFKNDIPLIEWCCYHADVNQCMNDGISPLFISSQEGHTEVIKFLLVNKADINKCRNDDTSPLFIACQNNCVDIVKLILNNNADIYKCRNDETSPLFIACQNNSVDIVKLLLNNNADIDKCRNDETSPLFIACQNNCVDIVKLLLNSNADINKCRNDETSPLFIACQNNYVDIVKLLLNNNADIYKCRNDETSTLFIACQNNCVDIVKLLLNSNADTNKCRNDETSPLFIACQNKCVNIVKLLLYKTIEIIISEGMMKHLRCL